MADSTGSTEKWIIQLALEDDGIAQQIEAVSQKIAERLEATGGSVKLIDPEALDKGFASLSAYGSELRKIKQEMLELSNNIGNIRGLGLAGPDLQAEIEKQVRARVQQIVGSGLPGSTGAQNRAEADRAISEYATRQGLPALDAEAEEARNRLTRAQSAYADVMQSSERTQQQVLRSQAELDRAQQAVAAVDAKRADAAAGAAVLQNYTPVDVTADPLSRANAALASAQERVMRAQQSYAEILDKEIVTEREALSTTQNLDRARQALAAATEKQDLEARRAGSPLDQFLLGFSGEDSQKSYLEQAGQAAKFSVLYGTAYKALFELQNVLKDTLKEGIDFQESVSALQLAAGSTAGSFQQVQEWANQLGQTAAANGAAPSVGVQVGAQALGLYDAIGTSQANQTAVADVTDRVATGLAALSKLKPEELATDLASVNRAYGGGAEAQQRTADLDAYFARRTGVAYGTGTQAAAESAALARDNGFTQEQVFAIVDTAMAHMGASPSAASGFLDQLLVRGSSTALAKVAPEFGANPNESMQAQLQDLSRAYREGNDKTKEAILTALGGRGKGRDFAAITLEDLPRINELAGGAQKGDALGAEADALKIHFNNVGGQLELLGGQFKLLENEISQSGLLDVIGAGVVALREVTTVAVDVVKAWNQLPHVARDVILAFGALALASRLGAVEGLAGRAGIALGENTGVTGLFGLRGATVGGSAAAGALDEAAILNGATAVESGVPLTFGAAATGLTGALTSAAAAVAPLAAVGSLVYGFSKVADANAAYADASNAATEALAASGKASTADEYASAASGLKNASQQAYDAAHKRMIFGLPDIFNVYSSSEQDQGAYLSQRAQFDQQTADLIAQHNTSLDSSNALITSFAPDALKTALDSITASGGTAREQLNALTAAINGGADAAARAKQSFDPKYFGQTNADPLIAAVSSGINSDKFAGYAAGSGASGLVFSVEQSLRQGLKSPNVAKALTGALSGKDLGSLSGAQLSGVADEVTKSLLTDTGAEGYLQANRPGTYASIQKDVQAIVLNYLKGQAKSLGDVVKGVIKLSPQDLEAAITATVAALQTTLNNLPKSDFNGRIAAAQQAVNAIVSAAAKNGDVDPAALLQIQNAKNLLAQAEFDKFEALRKVALANSANGASYAAKAQGILRSELQSAIKNGDADLLATIIAQAGSGAIAIAQAMINTESAAYQQFQAEQAQIEKLQTAALGPFAAVAGAAGEIFKQVNGGTVPGLSKSQTDLLNQVLKTTAPAGKNDAYSAGAFDKANGGGASHQYDFVKSAEAEARAARAGGGDVAAALAAVQSAQDQLDHNTKDSAAWWRAYAGLWQAKMQLVKAEATSIEDNYLLTHDATDPVVQAEAKAKAALFQLQQDKKLGFSSERTNQDLLAYNQAKESAVVAAQNQKLQDIQTAAQLGEISTAAELQYLEGQKALMDKIHHKTRDQINYTNSILQALKSANDSLSAMWNIGDISTNGLVYQVKAFEALATGGSSGTSVGALARTASVVNSNNTTTITIHGADIGQVEQLLDKHLGTRTRITTNRYRRP